MTELYSARGGSRETPGDPNWPLFGLQESASWPLCKLVMNDEEVHFKVLMGDRAFTYSDIKTVKVSQLGYVVFTVHGSKGAYGFSGKRLDKIVEILQSKDVKISKAELSKLRFAQNVVMAEFIFGTIFLLVWGSGMMFGITQLILHFGTGLR